ncbi:MAG: AsmA family protein [Desulfobulbia bacterium]
MKKLLSWLMGLFLGLLLLIVVLVVVVSFLQIPIDLTRFKEPIETLATKGLGRPVRIENSIVMSTSLKPYVTLQGLIIDNPPGFKTAEFMSMDQARIQVELLPVLARKLHLAEVQVKGLSINLEEKASGDANWIFTPSSAGKNETSVESETTAGPGKEPEPGQLENDTLVVRKLDLQDIKVDFYRPEQDDPAQFLLKTCEGSMVSGRPLQLDIDGKMLEHDYAIDVSVGSLEELLTENRSWMEIRAKIAGTKMFFAGNVDLATAAKSLRLNASVEGDNLASLNNILKVDLPPFKDYRLESGLHLQPNHFELQKLLVNTGASSLEGNAEIVRDDDLTTVTMELRSPLVQINDFVFDEYSWAGDAEDTPSGQEIAEEQKQSTEDAKPETANRKLIDPELLAKFDCSLIVEAEKVLSGEDFLGSGQLKATANKGRLNVSPLIFQLPGGKIEMSASVKPGAKKSDANLKVEISNFDIGILARRAKPDTNMGGFVNVDLDVQSSAATIPDLLGNGNGYFDFSGDLENFSAGIIDLWAVNLVAAIVTSANKEQSELNCAVGRWSAVDGLLQTDAFFMDTSKIRICGDGMVDFKEERIDLKVAPKAKKAEFFSLATPLEVHGSFEEIKIGLGGGGVVGTAVKFIASPVTAPLKRTFTDKIPANGEDVCNMALGPADRKDIKVPLCN